MQTGMPPLLMQSWYEPGDVRAELMSGIVNGYATGVPAKAHCCPGTRGHAFPPQPRQGLGALSRICNVQATQAALIGASRTFVIPANAGIHRAFAQFVAHEEAAKWIPAFAGMTVRRDSARLHCRAIFPAQRRAGTEGQPPNDRSRRVHRAVRHGAIERSATTRSFQ